MEFFYDRNKKKSKKAPYGRLATQQKMRLAMAFLNPLRPIINDTWKNYGDGKKTKAFGQALRKVIQDAITGDYPDQHIVPEKVMISMGTLPLPPIDDVARSTEQLEVFYGNLTHPMAKDGDELALVLINPEMGFGARNDQTCYRKDGHIEVKIPPPFKQHGFYAYLYAHNKKGTQYSKSCYLGYFEPRA
ncbi:hypothetical protein H8S90_12525 [Olivibacter sp. SDN3]|uniref:DUF6266 family protein n=1 Tax=Olivibacter sp. SDN3 TaxID=2764720 RepID=UPI001650DC51|nr:DUF6266 family protein [Olivibacter sp. SDN3]QNL52316.1 hypothetical protein H8S90_12525 [Olivibacter sp. SDN3]